MKMLVNQQVKDNCAEMHEQFVSARPFRHICIDDFLDESFARSLLEQFPAFDEKLAINENGEVGGKAVHESITDHGPVWQKLDRLVAGTQFRSLITGITGISELKFDPDYFGGGTHENLHGQSLNPHVDFNYHPLTRQHRRLNLILYLSTEWEQSWNGSMYYYTDSRPAEELGAEHSTIYVEEHLPEHYEAGMKLGGEELQHIRNLLTNRDQHLKRLYADIQQLNTDLNYLRSQLTSDQSIEDIEINENDSEELKFMKKRVAGLNARIRELQSSSSWRITRPLRSLKRALTGKG
jgi:hypothetical protein